MRPYIENLESSDYRLSRMERVLVRDPAPSDEPMWTKAPDGATAPHPFRESSSALPVAGSRSVCASGNINRKSWRVAMSSSRWLACIRAQSARRSSGLDRPPGAEGRTTMSTNQVPNSPNPVANTPQPVTTMTPKQVVEQLRSFRAQIPEVAPLTVEASNVRRAQSRASHVP